MIAGEQKAGTSYLQANLRKHPDVFMSRVKEPLFFSRFSFTPEAIPSYLEEHFSIAGSQRWVGEASALYYHSKHALDRVRTAFGREMKFIVCLRHPTEKVVSLYLHSYRRGRMRGDEELLDLDGEKAKLLSLASHAVASKRILRLFGPQNVCFLRFETLQENPSEFVNKALAFLDLRPCLEPIADVLNRGSDLVYDGDVLTIAGPPPFEGQVLPRFSVDDIMKVHEALQDDISRTEKVSGLDLSAWRRFPYDFSDRSKSAKGGISTSQFGGRRIDTSGN